MQDFARAKAEEQLTQKQFDAIVALVQNPKLADAAKEIGCDESTIYRWLQIPAFRETYACYRRELVRAAIAQAQRATSEAVEVLRQILNDTTAAKSSRISAARTILEIAVKAVEVEELETRLSDLERRLRK